MFYPWTSLSRHHPITTLCTRGSEQKRRSLAEEEAREGLRLCSKHIDIPSQWCHISDAWGGTLKRQIMTGWRLLATCRSQGGPGNTSRISYVGRGRTHKPWVGYTLQWSRRRSFSGRRYGGDPHMEMILGGFHKCVERLIMGQLPWKQSNRSWH